MASNERLNNNTGSIAKRVSSYRNEVVDKKRFKHLSSKSIQQRRNAETESINDFEKVELQITLPPKNDRASGLYT